MSLAFHCCCSQFCSRLCPRSTGIQTCWRCSYLTGCFVSKFTVFRGRGPLSVVINFLARTWSLWRNSSAADFSSFVTSSVHVSIQYRSHSWISVREKSSLFVQGEFVATLRRHWIMPGSLLGIGMVKTIFQFTYSLQGYVTVKARAELTPAAEGTELTSTIHLITSFVAIPRPSFHLNSIWFISTGLNTFIKQNMIQLIFK